MRVQINGGMIGVGDRFWFNTKNGLEVFEVDEIELQKTTSTKGTTNKTLFVWSANRTLFTEWQFANMFISERLATSIVVANGKKVSIGDHVWIWRSGPYPALVRKTIIKCNGEKIQCSYDDNLWLRKENPMNLYATEAEALQAEPRKARMLEQCLMRAGRNQGQRAA